MLDASSKEKYETCPVTSNLGGALIYSSSGPGHCAAVTSAFGAVTQSSRDTQAISLLTFCFHTPKVSCPSAAAAAPARPSPRASPWDGAQQQTPLGRKLSRLARSDRSSKAITFASSVSVSDVYRGLDEPGADGPGSPLARGLPRSVSHSESVIVRR